MIPVTRLDLPAVLLFDLLPVPFIILGGIFERKDSYPFIVASTFIPFASLLITLTLGIFQIVGIIIAASLLVNVFTYELGHETSYREGYYIAILLTGFECAVRSFPSVVRWGCSNTHSNNEIWYSVRDNNL